MTNDEIRMKNGEGGGTQGGGETSEPARTFDIGERSAVFGEQVVLLARSLPVDAVSKPLISQMVRAATSVGANYCEANDAGSKKEFRYRISICKRETSESKHWLRMIVVAIPSIKPKARPLWKEADELNRIFATIYRKSQDHKAS